LPQVDSNLIVKIKQTCEKLAPLCGVEKEKQQARMKARHAWI
jgi:hypothetical protein